MNNCYHLNILQPFSPKFKLSCHGQTHTHRITLYRTNWLACCYRLATPILRTRKHYWIVCPLSKHFISLSSSLGRVFFFLVDTHTFSSRKLFSFSFLTINEGCFEWRMPQARLTAVVRSVGGWLICLQHTSLVFIHLVSGSDGPRQISYVHGYFLLLELFFF